MQSYNTTPQLDIHTYIHTQIHISTVKTYWEKEQKEEEYSFTKIKSKKKISAILPAEFNFIRVNVKSEEVPKKNILYSTEKKTKKNETFFR